MFKKRNEPLSGNSSIQRGLKIERSIENYFMKYLPIEKPEILAGIGGLSLTLAIILGMFFTGIPASAFLQGMFTGMSLVLNVASIIRWRMQRQAT